VGYADTPNAFIRSGAAMVIVDQRLYDSNPCQHKIKRRVSAGFLVDKDW
jgi:hypothetical protein